MRAMDSSHVALASLTLTPASFSLFRCSEQATVGVQFDALSTVLKSCAVDDEIKLEYDVDSDHLTIMRGEDRQWELKLLDIEADETTIPEQSYDVSAIIPSFEFLKVCRDLKEIGGETITIRVTDGSTISCSVEGHHGRATAVLKDGISIECACEMEDKMSYALRYLASFAKGSPLCSTVRIQMGKGTPLCMTYDFTEGHGCLQFFLAPRIDDD